MPARIGVIYAVSFVADNKSKIYIKGVELGKSFNGENHEKIPKMFFLICLKLKR